MGLVLVNTVKQDMSETDDRSLEHCKQVLIIVLSEVNTVKQSKNLSQALGLMNTVYEDNV